MAKKKVIAFVDDEPDIRLTVREILEASDYKVILFDSGKKFLDYLDSNKPDLILMDIMMPGMSGWELSAKVKSNPKLKSIPLIFVTGRTDDLSKSMGSEGADGYVEKPFDPATLVQKIKSFMK